MSCEDEPLTNRSTDFLSLMPGEAPSQAVQGGPKGLSAKPGVSFKAQKNVREYLFPSANTHVRSSLSPSVRLRDFSRSNFPTAVARRRAFQRAYYRQYRLAHLDAYRQTQQKYLTAHPWQVIYKGIKTRCNNPNDKNYFYYGAQGIKCLLTLQDVKFLWFRDHADRLSQASIDRIDPYGHYSLDNCRFIEHRENSGRKIRRIKRAHRRVASIAFLLLTNISPVAEAAVSAAAVRGGLA